MKLYSSDEQSYVLEIGKWITRIYRDIYSDLYVASANNLIRRYMHACSRGGGKTCDEIFYQSVYDYWMYGLSIEEEFYLHFLEKSSREKETYITHMGRMQYMSFLNSKKDEYLLKNKYETFKIFQDEFYRDVILLKDVSDYNLFESFCQKHKSFVVKPVGLAVSIGIRKVNISDYSDIWECFNALLDEMEIINSRYKWSSEYGVLVEELINQGEGMAVLHPSSVNSIRFTTINIDGDVHVWYPVIRIGVHGNFLCCGAVGSILAGINPLTGITETEGYNEKAENFSFHPDTGIPIKGIQIPKWDELCAKAQKMALRLPSLRYIGWDFVYNDNNEWCLMEANENGEFLSQIVYQKGQKKEFEELIGWHPQTKYWWEGKYPNKFDL